MKKNWEKLFQIMRDDFQLTDLVGFARLLGVKENDNFEDLWLKFWILTINKKRSDNGYFYLWHVMWRQPTKS